MEKENQAENAKDESIVFDVENVESVGNAMLIDGLFEEMPEVQQHAVDQFKGEEQEKLAQIEKLQNNHPGFNPETDAVDDHGNPVMNRSGSFRKKRGKNKSNSTIGGTDIASNINDIDQAPAQAARDLLNTFYGGNAMIFGESAIPTPAADTAMHGAFTSMAKATGAKEMPWQVQMGLALGGYYGALLEQEQHKEKLTALMSFSEKMTGFAGRQIGKIKYLFNKVANK